MAALKPWHDITIDGKPRPSFIPDSLIKPEKITSKHIQIAETGFEVCKTYFGDELFFTQSLIFGICLDPDILQSLFITTSRYGKSWTLAKVAITLGGLFHRRVLVGGADEEKARLIMKYVLQTISKSNPILKQGLIGQDKIEKLQASLSKDQISWFDGGAIDIFGLSERLKNTGVAGMAGIGEGADVIILDESALISDDNYSVAKRMIAEKEETKIIEISNPHQKNHFFRAYNNPEYMVVHMDKYTMLQENRLTEKKLNMAMADMTSKERVIFFDCRFPNENEFTYFKPQTYGQIDLVNTETRKMKRMKYYGAVDPATGNVKKGCLTGITVLGVSQEQEDFGQVYEIESIGETLTPEETIERILKLPYTFTRFGVEAVLFQEFFYRVIDQKSKALGIRIPFIAIKQKRKKEIRLEALEPHVRSGHIKFKGGNELWDEMQNYPTGEFVDVLDSCEMAFRLIHERVTDTKGTPERFFNRMGAKKKSLIKNSMIKMRR